MITLDPWQQKILDTSGNIVLRSGRQCGKSTVIAQKAGNFALKNPKKTILVIASVERQAYLLFEKILSYIFETNRQSIRKGRFRPTKSKLMLTNGSTIYCLPTGLSGQGIRGYTIDMLIADEAAFIPEDVWAAVSPMLATTKGDIVLLSTPFGKGGYFFRAFQDPSFTNFHVSSEDCPRIPKEYLAQEKASMSKLSYSQEYLGEFVDELRQFFPTALIESILTQDTSTNVSPQSTPLFAQTKHFLGVDVARLGGDETVLFSLSMNQQTKLLTELDLKIYDENKITDTVREILHYDQRYNYKKIYIDDGGLGVGVFDPLLEHNQTKRKVIPINNSARSIERDRIKGRKKRLLKEDLYNNLLWLMETRQILLKRNADTFNSLKSIQCEYTDDGKMKIFGRYAHITEALIRACWCVKDKSLNLWCVYS